jgi:hypothetical protein
LALEKYSFKTRFKNPFLSIPIPFTLFIIMLYFSHDDLMTLTDANYSSEPDFSLTLELVDAMKENYD